MKLQQSALSIVGAVGGSGVIIVGLSVWLGQIIASNIEVSTKAKLDKEIASLQVTHEKQIVRLQSKLELSRAQQKRSSDARFGLYREVWSQLMDLQSAGDRLWENASQENLESFIALLEKAKLATNRGRLILREKHYLELQKAFQEFGNYEIGKQYLIDLRSPDQLKELYKSSNAEEEIRRQIHVNDRAKQSYEAATKEILEEFRQQLGLAP